jgi:hypothetical protein
MKLYVDVNFEFEAPDGSNPNEIIDIIKAELAILSSGHITFAYTMAMKEITAKKAVLLHWSDNPSPQG